MAPGTERRYGLAWTRWTAFIKLLADEPLAEDFEPADLTTHEVTRLLLHFVSYLAVDLKLTGSNIDNTLSGLRHHFLKRLLPVDAFGDATLSALKESFRKNPNNQPKFRTRRLPYTLNMVRYIVDASTAQGTLEGNMIAAATVTAFVCLLRASEYTSSTRDTNHTIAAAAVEFQCLLPGHRQPCMIPSHRLPSIAGVLPRRATSPHHAPQREEHQAGRKPNHVVLRQDPR